MKSAKSPNTERFRKVNGMAPKAIVAEVMRRHPETKNNDKLLDFRVQEYVLVEMGVLDKDASAADFFRAAVTHVVPSAVTIHHVRRRLQSRGKFKPTDAEVRSTRERHRLAARSGRLCPECERRLCEAGRPAA